MKKSFAFISLFLCLSAGMLFADITAKKLDDGNVEATFFYGNPRASEVLLAGDFTNWQNGALAMTKVDNGFTLTKVFPAGTTVRYKFISDGNWTTDLKAPDFVDDGFGGKNSLAELDSLAGGQTTAKSGLKFLTWSMLGYQMKFQTHEDTAQEIDKGLVSAGVNLKSYFKVTGDALPNVPVYFEIATAEQDSFENLYKQNELSWTDGLQDFGLDLLFAPMHELNGEKKAGTYLGHFKFGITTNYVDWTTGYKYAKLPPHNINDWITVDKEWEAGYEDVGGFNYFELGQKLQQIGPVEIKAALAPNKAADRKGSQYGFFGWVNVNAGKELNFDFQYNTALGKTWDTIFGHCYEQDFIAGYKGIFGPVTVKANYLANLYGDGDLSRVDGVTYVSKYIPATSDVGEVDSDASGLTNMAANVQVKFSSEFIEATLGGRFRGSQASMMYVEDGADDHTNISDQLGDRNHMKAWLDVNATVRDGVKIGLQPEVTMVLDKNDAELPYTDKDNIAIYGKPYFSLDLNELFWIPATIQGEAELTYNTIDNFKRGNTESQFAVERGGLKYEQTFENDIIKSASFLYGFDNTNEKHLFNTLISQLMFAGDYTVHAGVGVRTAWEGADAPNNPVGFFLGASKKIPVLARPTAYCQFLYAMDPYQAFGDGPTAFKMSSDSDYITKDGVDDYKDSYAVRVGLHWDL